MGPAKHRFGQAIFLLVLQHKRRTRTAGASGGKEGKTLNEKFLGLGLTKILGLWLCLVLLTVGAKTVLTKHPVPGLSEIIQAI